jgi:Na+/H+ antiporter NhaC
MLYLIQGIMKFSEIFDVAIEGFKTMIFPLLIVISSYILIDVNDALGLTDYVISSVKPILSSSLLPVVVFVVLALVAFASGSFWGVYAVSLPIVLPLAIELGVHLPLAIGAVISAGGFGSHACFYADATVLSAKGSGCKSMDHALTQLPYVLISAGIASIMFILAGFII